MKVLCVAEKPSIAKSIAEILASNGFTSRPGKDKFCRNFDLSYRLGEHGWVDMTMTSVRGHLTENDFSETHRKWHSCDPLALFDAPVETRLSKDGQLIAANLRNEARQAQILMIWTDCDREGEHIGAEVVRECQKVNRRIQVKRARFSAIIANQIHAACQNAGELDWAAAAAVEARQEIDLRVGAALTRMQTMNLKNSVPELADYLISYGSCQFPTLGFVVDQYERVRSFVPEDFWHIVVTHKKREHPQGPLQTVDFKWRRGHLFDHSVVKMLHEGCKEEEEAEVVKVTSKPARKFKPYPLTTVELQKSGSRLLRMAPKRILDLAESLYNKGLLSYPRTETDQYDKAFDFHSLVQKQTSDGSWGGYAQGLLDGAYERPRNGNKNDKAHPPIHPTAHANQNISPDERQVYDYVTRRFLASCSKDAMGKQTTVEIELGDEFFSAGGLVVHERNYLDVFHYDKWGGTVLPPYEQGERFKPSAVTLKKGSTSRPSLLTEADLVSLMDKHGIGTDATIAEHIAKVISREYVLTLKEGKTTYLTPSTLGMGLVEGYNTIDFEKSLCKPLLRRETEFRMNLICEGQRTKQETLDESLEEYKAVYLTAKRDFRELVKSVTKYLRADPATLAAQAGGGGGGLDDGDGDGDADADADIDDGGSDDNDAPPRPPGRTRAPATRGPVSGSTSSRGRSMRTAPTATTTSSTNGYGHRQPLVPVDSNQEPTCRCGEAAVRRTVAKAGANQGRQFWSCAKGQNEGSCGFFDWADDANVGSSSRTVASPSRARSSTGSRKRSPSATRLLSPPRATSRKRATAASASTASRPAERSYATTTTTTIASSSSGPSRLAPAFAIGPPRFDSDSPPPAAMTRDEIEARNESIALIDQLANMSSSPETVRSDGGFGRNAGRRLQNAIDVDDDEIGHAGAGLAVRGGIEAYHQWFAALGQEDPSTSSRWSSTATTAGAGAGAASPLAPVQKRCDCNLLPHAPHTVTKPGPNQGRQFVCCPKENRAVRCGFFEWCDEDDTGQGAAGFEGNNGRVDQPSKSSKSTAYTSSTTTTTTTNRSSTSRTYASGPSDFDTSSSVSNSVGDKCFTCGEVGHWSAECPESGSINARGSSGGGGGGGGGGFGQRISRGGGGSRGRGRGRVRARGRGGGAGRRGR